MNHMKMIHRPLSTIGRMHAARDAAEARRADREDQGNRLKRRLRAELVGLTEIADVARRQWEAENRLIPAPSAFGGPALHPTRVAALRDFMQSQGWSDDPSEPIVEMTSLAEMAARMGVAGRERLAAVEAELAAYQDERHREALGNAVEPAGETVVQAVAETPRRRGRPPRVVIDADAPLQPE